MEGISDDTGGNNKIINWDIDVTHAGFEQKEEFGSGPALLKGDPMKGCHVFSGIPFNKGVVPGHIACSSLLNFFQLLNVVLLVGVPDAAAIFDGRADECVIASFFSGFWAGVCVPPQKSEG